MKACAKVEIGSVGLMLRHDSHAESRSMSTLMCDKLEVESLFNTIQEAARIGWRIRLAVAVLPLLVPTSRFDVLYLARLLTNG